MSLKPSEWAPRARDLIDEANRRAIRLRAVGGVGVWMSLPEPLRVAYDAARERPKDLDLVTTEGTDSDLLIDLFRGFGYVPDQRLIDWHGDRRHQYFELDDSGEPVLDIDVFVGPPPACHSFKLLDSSFEENDYSLARTELLLQKIQVNEPSSRDVVDAAFLLIADREGSVTPIDRTRIVQILAKDWGFYHSAELNLDRIAEITPQFDHELREPLEAALATLRDEMEAEPKGLKWKARAKVGERKQWYEDVEELDR